MYKVGVIILCRFSSNRLPGKILQKIDNKPILEYIIEKLLTILDIKDIVIATSTENSDNPIVDYCKDYSINYYRGSLHNVAQRFLGASLEYGFDYSIRINGDNLFLDTKTIQEMIQITQNNEYDFISNVKGRTFPKGMSVEIINVDIYKHLIQSFNTSSHLEHVTKYLYENEKALNTYYFYNSRLPEAGGEQLAVDTPDDLKMAKKILSKFSGSHLKLDLEKVYKLKQRIHVEK